MRVEKYFAYQHLPEHLQTVSKLFADCVNNLTVSQLTNTIAKLKELEVYDEHELNVAVYKLVDAKGLLVTSNASKTSYNEQVIRCILEAKDCAVRAVIK